MAIPLGTEMFVQMLREGVVHWNSFRREHQSFIIMNCARLAEAQLPDIDLHQVLLMESDLQRANLSCANFERSVLRKSDLRGSDLRSANLDGADLCRANLSCADLRGASMTSTFLARTDLTGADLSTARGLTMAQIIDAIGDDRTKLPLGLVRPTGWCTVSSASRSA
jgi:uncharacterized protein YjbI with pentapeptide repeats